MTVFHHLAAAAPGLPPVFPGAQPALALFPGWSPLATVVALGVVGVALVFLAGLIVGDVIRLWKEGRR